MRKFLLPVLFIFLLEAAGQFYYFVRHFPATYWENYRPKAFSSFSVYGAYEYIPGKPVDLRGIGYPVDFLGVDRYGFVHNGEDRPFQQKEEIILLLGGSTVEGRGASSNARTIAARLEALFQKKFPGRNFRVVNAGRAGYIAYQELALLTGRIPQILNPRLVIALDGRNDADPAIGHADYGWKPNWQPYFDTLTQDVNRRMSGQTRPMAEFRSWLVAHSFLAGALERILKPRPPVTFYAPQEKAPSLEILQKAALAYLLNHDIAFASSRAQGAGYYVFLQPVLLESRKSLTAEEKGIQQEWGRHYKGPFFWPALESFYGEVARQAKGRPFFHDLSLIFQNIPARLYWDNCHYNDAGNEFIAEKIFSVIQKEFESGAAA